MDATGPHTRLLAAEEITCLNGTSNRPNGDDNTNNLAHGLTHYDAAPHVAAAHNETGTDIPIYSQHYANIIIHAHNEHYREQELMVRGEQ